MNAHVEIPPVMDEMVSLKNCVTSDPAELCLFVEQEENVSQNMPKVKKMLKPSKPQFREKLLAKGAQNLSDEELAAILLRTGSQEKSVQILSREVMRVLDKGENGKLAESLLKIKGLGDTRICTVLAALELGRRFFCTDGSKITAPKKLVPFLMHYAIRKQETFICASLSGANEVLAIRVVSVGTINRTLVHPREVFADPITDRAASIIIAHNHPSGNLMPSEEDILLTHRLVSSGNLLGITLLDHLIINAEGDYFSMMEHNLLDSASL